MDRSQNASEDLTDSSQDTTLSRQRAQRLPAHERRASILSEAAAFFAEQGFAASTRDLADRLGVRQALLYKYYPSKDALLESIFESVFSAPVTAGWLQALADRSQPLGERIFTVYRHYTQDDGGIGIRLFLRASLDSASLNHALVAHYSDQLAMLLLGELRHDSELPDLEAVAPLVGEYELALMLHGAILFCQIRPAGQRTPDGATGPAVLRFYIATFLDGARAQMKALHDGSAPAELSVPLV